MTVTRTALVLWFVAILAVVLGLVIPALRFAPVAGAIAVVACVVLDFRGRSRPDVPIADD